jgi:hypothetical protein
MDRLHCPCCREVIGVYEPMWVILRDGSEHAGSCLSLALELREQESVGLHQRCHRSDADWRAQQRHRELSSRWHWE